MPTTGPPPHEHAACFRCGRLGFIRVPRMAVLTHSDTPNETGQALEDVPCPTCKGRGTVCLPPTLTHPLPPLP